MINHIWTVLCTRPSTDRETNNISLFDVIEQLNVLGPMPEAAANVALPIPYEVVTLWARALPAEAEESAARLTLIAPNNAEIHTQQFSVNLTQKARMRTQLRSLGFPLRGAGRYIFKLEIQRVQGNWDTVARIPIEVDPIAQANAPA